MLSSQPQEISLEALASHKSDDSLWLAVHGTVYDLSTFGPDHPGGIEVLRDCAGTDATETYEYAGHGAEAKQKLDEFRIGVLCNDTPAAQAPSTPKSQPEPHSTPSHKSPPISAPNSSPSQGIISGRAQKMLFLGPGIAMPILMMMMIYGLKPWTVVPNMLTPIHPESPLFSSGLNSFLAGVGLAALMGSFGLAYGYQVFAKTLDYDNEVFAYPATIPRQRRF